MGKSIFDFVPEQEKTPIKEVPLQSDGSPSVFDRISTPQESAVNKDQDLELPKEESEIQAGIRHVARTATRIGETPIEVAKGLSDLPKKGIEFLVEHVTGSPLSPEARERIEKFHENLGGLAQQLPSTEKIREKEKEFTGEYLQPQSKKEALADEVTQDLAAFMLPLPGTTEARLVDKLARGAKVVGAGQAAKQTVKAFGGDEEKGDYAKLGTMFLTSLWNPRGAEKMVEGKYNEAFRNLPENAKGNTEKLDKSLSEISDEWAKRNKTAGGEKVLNEVAQIKDKISQGKLDYETAHETKTSVNNNAKTLYSKEIPKEDRKIAARDYLRINKALTEYLGTSKEMHPKFWENYKAANDAFGAIAQSNKFSNFVRGHLPLLASAGISPYIQELFSGNLSFLGPLTGKVAAGYTASKGAQILARMAKNPTLRRYYLNALKSASEENAGATVKNIKVFQKKAEEDPELAAILRED